MTDATEIKIPVHPIQYCASQRQGQYYLHYDTIQSQFNLQFSSTDYHRYNFLLDYHRFQFSIFKVVKEQGVALKRRFALVLNLNAEFDFGLHSATQVGNRSKVGNEAY